MRSLGFIGAGVMGSGMIETLQQHEWLVRVYDSDPSKLENVKRFGSVSSSSVHDVACYEPIVCLSLPGPKQVRAIVDQLIGVWDQNQIKGTIVDFSTIDPMTAVQVESVARQHDARYIEAPVSGGPKGASSGTLSIMVSGDQAAAENLNQLFNVLGENIYYVGSPGRAQLIKLCNNAVVGTTMAIIGEVSILASQAGITPSELLEILSKSVGGSRTLEVFGPHLVSGNFTPPTFALNLMAKDIALYLQTAGEYRVPSLLGGLVNQVYQAATMRDVGSLDHSAVVKVLEDIGQVAIRR